MKNIELNLLSGSHVNLYLGDCGKWIRTKKNNLPEFDVTFLDPPFNQGKDYRSHNDLMDSEDYWEWMHEICRRTLELSSEGAAIYFMQREKNAESVLRILRESGWCFQNLIIWKKKTSAVPSRTRYGKAFQIIAFATNGPRPRVFNRLRINPPLPVGYQARPDGVFVTDIWDDIRELTAGYFAGDEAIRDHSGERAHNQQSPIALLLRLILTSSLPNDHIFDPFAGTGTTLCTATQLGRISTGVEKDITNAQLIADRINNLRPADNIGKYYKDYIHTPTLNSIWHTSYFHIDNSSASGATQPQLPLRV